jgi:GNAT superfamily N-acetyltransferase
MQREKREMLEFVKVKEENLFLLTDIAIKAFNDDKIKYGSMPPGIEFEATHKKYMNDGYYYKILNNDKIIGGIIVFELKDREHRLGGIFIDPDYQNIGIGKTAIEFIENNFPDAKSWSLDTPHLNYRNHYFYEKMGYVKIRELYPKNDRNFCLFLYEKQMN